MSLSCQLCKNNLFNTITQIKSLSFYLGLDVAWKQSSAKVNSLLWKMKRMLKGLSTFLTCSPNCYYVLKQVKIFHFLHQSCAYQQLWHIFTWSYFNQCFHPVCVGCLYPQCRVFFGSLELDHQSAIAHPHLQKNKNDRTFPSTKSCVLIKQRWCIGTSQTRWLSFPHLQKEFEEKVGNGLTELSTSWEVGLTSTCYYIWHLDVNAAHTHTHPPTHTHTRSSSMLMYI